MTTCLIPRGAAGGQDRPACFCLSIQSGCRPTCRQNLRAREGPLSSIRTNRKPSELSEIHQLLDHSFPEMIDIHTTSRGKIPELPLGLARDTHGIGATPCSLSSPESDSLNMQGMSKETQRITRFPLGRNRLNDLRNNFTCFFDQDEIAYPDIFANDLVGVVKACPRYGRTRQLNRTKAGNGGYGTGPSHLQNDFFQKSFLSFRFEFMRLWPNEAPGRTPGNLLHLE